jgi:hypothetical protein
MLRALVLAFVVVAGSVAGTAAKADIIDRIDSCEARGGGACVFDLLRELAVQQPSPGCQGDLAGGVCWYKGTVGKSCTQVCAAEGLRYDSRTSRAENNDACREAAVALGSTGNGVVNGQASCGGAENGTGCGFWPNGAASVFWCGGTSPDAASSSVARFCGCK